MPKTKKAPRKRVAYWKQFSIKCGTCGGCTDCWESPNCRRCREWHSQFAASREEMAEQHYQAMQAWGQQQESRKEQ